MELPRFIPIFPLPNVILFPEVPLPLHIFEPRYREMVRDALAGSGLIGIVLLRGDWERDYYGAPEVYRVGCAGKIASATPLPDGKFNIVLVGLREFEIVSEQRERSYRQATVVWRPPASNDPVPPTLRGELLQMAERHMGRFGDAEVRELLSDAPIDDAALVNFLAFWLDLSPIEKQCLLEAPSETRARRLRDIMEFHLYATRGGNLGTATRRVH